MSDTTAGIDATPLRSCLKAHVEQQGTPILTRRRGDAGYTPVVPPLRRAQDFNRTLLAIIDDRSLTRASVSAMLEVGAPEFSVLRYSDPKELLSGEASLDRRLNLILLKFDAVGEMGGDAFDIIGLAKAYPDAPLIVLSDHINHDSLVEIFRCGARGFLPTSISPKVAIQALRLVSQGGSYVPADMLIDALGSLDQGCKEESMRVRGVTITETLTRRELDVLELLQNGESNKVIGRELDMQECTVKVHMRHIMKKLDATNRTQAALMAREICALDANAED